ncbi:NADH-quinone oxidoreductase subunit NuoE [Aurantimonas sp. A2-1-M11]|uniref:NADH-quinone oxidoreductase subunit NuoE n=1 Tax=Aurantimonas sp. A2-1-M11 TaxID=3113712 RepID=UPI002F92EEEC
MSVRRLADDSIQPHGFAFSEENAAWAQATIRKYPAERQQSAVIPLLMRAQDQDGWVTKAAIEHVADMLAMPLIRVLEVATFYTQFQLKPVGTRAHIQLCGTTPCMLRGAEDLKAVCRSKIHAEPFHRNEAGTLSWEEVECLGACVNAPMVMVFHDTYEDLTPERLEEIIDAFEAGRGADVTPGPQNGRHQSAPLGGLTTLKGDYDDLIADRKSEGGPANGAPAQGAGAGQAVSSLSKAGRPDTAAAETDPSISAAGKADEANAPKGTESEESDELLAEAGPGAGHTGGAREGATGEADRDAAEADQVSADSPNADVSTAGNLAAKEGTAEAAVVRDERRPGDVPGNQTRDGEAVDLTGRDQVSPGTPEALRSDTADTSSGPGNADHFASEAEPAAAPAEVGVKPADLLDAPQGAKDDLKRIKGVGPVIEGRLNGLGVFHFRQIAEWRPAELIWIDDYLNFRGRAVREGWIEQAKELVSSSSSGSGQR